MKKFKYIFVAVEACIEGIKAMRQVLSVDAIFFKIVHSGDVIYHGFYRF